MFVKEHTVPVRPGSIETLGVMRIFEQFLMCLSIEVGNI